MNSRLDEVQAAILRIKLKQLDADNKKRETLAKEYMKNLTGLEEINILDYGRMKFANFHLLVIKSQKRNELKNYLKKKGVQTGIHYPLLIPNQPFMKRVRYRAYELPEAERMTREVLTLPCHPLMTKTDVRYVCNNIRTFLRGES